MRAFTKCRFALRLLVVHMNLIWRDEKHSTKKTRKNMSFKKCTSRWLYNSMIQQYNNCCVVLIVVLILIVESYSDETFSFNGFSIFSFDVFFARHIELLTLL